MSQHDNGRRAAGHQGAPWQQAGTQRLPTAMDSRTPPRGGIPATSRAASRVAIVTAATLTHTKTSTRRRAASKAIIGASPPAVGHRGASHDSPCGPSSSHGGRGRRDGQAADNDDGHRGITERGNFDNGASGAQQQPRHQILRRRRLPGQLDAGHPGQIHHDADYQQ